MPFDSESGQMYTETFASLPTKDEDDLIYVEKVGHIRDRPKGGYSINGTRTMYEMAMTKMLQNLDLLNPDLLKATPGPILKQIWKAIKNEKLDGLKMWKLFASTGVDGLPARRVVKRPLTGFFAHPIGQGSSSDCAWLTHLTLKAIPLAMADYLQVSKMPNLTSLAVLSGSMKDTDFSDRVLRAWASDAKTGSFQRLQHMLASGHRHVTEQSLAYLSCFKTLKLFCANDCWSYMSSSHNATGDASSGLEPHSWHDPAK